MHSDTKSWRCIQQVLHQLPANTSEGAGRDVDADGVKTPSVTVFFSYLFSVLSSRVIVYGQDLLLRNELSKHSL